MAYPLGSTARSGVAQIDDGGNTPLPITATRVWRNDLFNSGTNIPQNLYPSVNRTVAIRIQQVGVIGAEANLGIQGNRRWAGLGGLVYIPSFPQLSRNETTWPHAT